MVDLYFYRDPEEVTIFISVLNEHAAFLSGFPRCPGKREMSVNLKTGAPGLEKSGN
jgi:hypothetical protein